MGDYNLPPDVERIIGDLAARLGVLERPTPHIMARASVGSVSIPNITQTMVSFNGTDFDTGGMWSAGSPTRLTAIFAGVYLIIGTLSYSSNATGERYINLCKNGANNFASQEQKSNTVNVTALNASETFRAAAGDFFQLQTLQDSGGPLTAFNVGFSAVYLGPL